MKNKLVILLVVSVGISYTKMGNRPIESQESIVIKTNNKKVQHLYHAIEPHPNKRISKLQQLQQKPKGTVIEYCDLSNDNISKFPNLSGYTIYYLNLSHNQLDTLILGYLPKGIRKLDLSHNHLRGFFSLRFHPKKWVFHEMQERYKKHPLREINLSHNEITMLDMGLAMRKIIVSYNKLTYVGFNHKYIEYLDISHNPTLSNEVDFRPEKVDTIIREGIANDKALIDKDAELRLR